MPHLISIPSFPTQESTTKRSLSLADVAAKAKMSPAILLSLLIGGGLVVLLLTGFVVWKYYQFRRPMRHRLGSSADLVDNKRPFLLRAVKQGVIISDASTRPTPPPPVAILLPRTEPLMSSRDAASLQRAGYLKFERSPNMPASGIAMDDKWAENFKVVPLDSTDLITQPGQRTKRGVHSKHSQNSSKVRTPPARTSPVLLADASAAVGFARALREERREHVPGSPTPGQAKRSPKRRGSNMEHGLAAR